MGSKEECLDEIGERCISGPHPTFFKKHFPNIDNTAYRRAIDALNNSSAIFSLPLSADTLPQWLSALSSTELSNGLATWKPAPAFRPKADWLTGINLVLEYMESPKRQDHMDCTWENVQAICHLSKGDESYQSYLAQLYLMASHVFRSQPVRLAVHAVLVHGLVFEAWVFDKSGMYVSEPLDLVQDRARVLSVLLQYSQKSREDLGWRSLERNEQNQAYITVGDTKARYFFGKRSFCASWRTVQ